MSLLPWWEVRYLDALQTVKQILQAFKVAEDIHGPHEHLIVALHKVVIDVKGGANIVGCVDEGCNMRVIHHPMPILNVQKG